MTDLMEAPARIVTDRFECPPDHRHDETQTCYAQHKCRCWPCLGRRGADVQRWAAAREARQPSEPKPPREPRHGTLAGWMHHRREDEQPCAACRAYHSGYQKGRRSRRTAVPVAVSMRLAPSVVRDVLGALELRAKQMDHAGRTRGGEAPLWRGRADRLREASELIQEQIGDPS